MTNYTVGLHLRVFDFLIFILQGPQFCKKLYSRVVKNRNFFLYFRVRGKAQHSDPPPHFLLEVPPLGLEWTFGGEIVDELYEYKNLGDLKNYIGSFSSNVDDNMEKTCVRLG